MDTQVFIPQLNINTTHENIIVMLRKIFPLLFTQDAVQLLQATDERIIATYLQDPLYGSQLVTASNYVAKNMKKTITVDIDIPTDIMSKILSMAKVNILRLSKAERYHSVACDNNYWKSFLSNTLKVTIHIDNDWRSMYNDINRAMNVDSFTVVRKEVLLCCADAGLLAPVKFICTVKKQTIAKIQEAFTKACRGRYIDVARYLLSIISPDDREEEIDYNIVLDSISTDDLEFATEVYDSFMLKETMTTISLVSERIESMKPEILSFLISRFDEYDLNDEGEFLNGVLNHVSDLSPDSYEDILEYSERKIILIKILMAELYPKMNHYDFCERLTCACYNASICGHIEMIDYIQSLGIVTLDDSTMLKCAVDIEFLEILTDGDLEIELMKRKYKLIQKYMRSVNNGRIIKEFEVAIKMERAFIYQALYDYVGEILRGPMARGRGIQSVDKAWNLYEGLERDMSIDYSK